MLVSAECTCARCGASIIRKPDSISTGYGTMENGDRHCFDCCAAADRQWMQDKGRITLYLTWDGKDRRNPRVSNWPGSLSFDASPVRVGRHNIAGRQYRVYFWVNGQEWTGVQYGDNAQVCHCRRLKG